MKKKGYLAYVLLIALCIDAKEHIKKALIIGVTGQDGSYLAELLLEKGYEVHGVKRRSSLLNNTERIDHLFRDQRQYPHSRFHLHFGDITDALNITRLIATIAPDEIYNLAAQSHVAVSFELPEYTAEVDALGTLRILEAIRILGLARSTRFYQASTSELYGLVQEIPQTELTSFYPRSPYGVAKLYAYWITKNYREAYGMFACNGILFNHESPRRGETFVTRKIARAVARIAVGLQQELYLGNLNALRDWGHAKDYVQAMWLILQQDVPEDFVVATGCVHSVREFVKQAFAYVNVDIAWEGVGMDEVGRDKQSGVVRVRIDKQYFRPSEVDLLVGDASKAKEKLGWQPHITFEQLVSEMMEHEMNVIQEQRQRI